MYDGISRRGCENNRANDDGITRATGPGDDTDCLPVDAWLNVTRVGLPGGGDVDPLACYSIRIPLDRPMDPPPPSSMDHSHLQHHMPHIHPLRNKYTHLEPIKYSIGRLGNSNRQIKLRVDLGGFDGGTFYHSLGMYDCWRVTIFNSDMTGPNGFRNNNLFLWASIEDVDMEHGGGSEHDFQLIPIAAGGGITQRGVHIIVPALPVVGRHESLGYGREATAEDAEHHRPRRRGDGGVQKNRRMIIGDSTCSRATWVQRSIRIRIFEIDHLPTIDFRCRSMINHHDIYFPHRHGCDVGRALAKSGQFFDVHLVPRSPGGEGTCGGLGIPAHRCMLASTSPIFTHWLERRNGEDQQAAAPPVGITNIPMPDYTHAELRTAVDFLYIQGQTAGPSDDSPYTLDQLCTIQRFCDQFQCLQALRAVEALLASMVYDSCYSNKSLTYGLHSSERLRNICRGSLSIADLATMYAGPCLSMPSMRYFIEPILTQLSHDHAVDLCDESVPSYPKIPLLPVSAMDQFEQLYMAYKTYTAVKPFHVDQAWELANDPEQYGQDERESVSNDAHDDHNIGPVLRILQRPNAAVE